MREFRSRRGFIKKSTLACFATLLGTEIAFGEYMPEGLLPLALTQSKEPKIEGKHPDIIVLNDRPWNAELPAHLLDDSITPTDCLFVRNNGIPPLKTNINTWALSVAGEAAKTAKTYDLNELKKRFKHYTYQLTIECGGNGRKEYDPPASGNQWGTGAVGCPDWTGVRLRDVLEDVGIEEQAVYIGYYGKDTHLSRDPDKTVISRGVPIAKALEDESLIAWKINGKPLPILHGYPLRLVFGGWPASTSGKWLYKIVIRNQIHDGAKMGGYAYRVPCNPVAPGTNVSEMNMCIIESMPIKSLITYPKSGAIIQGDNSFQVRGHAWAGDYKVNDVRISIDFGSTWQKCSFQEPKNRLAWQRWNTQLKLPKRGYYEIWVRATDTQGNTQPMVVPGWNPKGYLNNACHRIAVKCIGT